MNAEWFGDSYDVVKRFFIGALRDLEYEVYVDPMPTGEWEAHEHRFLSFLGARHIRDARPGKAAVLLDPDTGIGRRRSKKHTTVSDVVAYADIHEIVFVFDQSFRRGDLERHLQEKLASFAAAGVAAFYYHSHANFLFASRSQHALDNVRKGFIETGLPSWRFVTPTPGARSPTRPRS